MNDEIINRIKNVQEQVFKKIGCQYNELDKLEAIYLNNSKPSKKTIDNLMNSFTRRAYDRGIWNEDMAAMIDLIDENIKS